MVSGSLDLSFEAVSDNYFFKFEAWQSEVTSTDSRRNGTHYQMCDAVRLRVKKGESGEINLEIRQMILDTTERPKPTLEDANSGNTMPPGRVIWSKIVPIRLSVKRDWARNRTLPTTQPTPTGQ